MSSAFSGSTPTVSNTSPTGVPAVAATGGGASEAALSARNVSITRKVNKLLDVDASDQFRQILQHTEEVCPHLLTSDGVKLRGARLQNAITVPLHQHVLALHDDFLAQLKEIRDVYRLVASDVKELEQVATDLHASMADAAAKAEPLVTAVTVYREELKEIKIREQQVKELMGRYNISEEETALLQDGPIDEAFLRVVLKVRSIHQNCSDLLIVDHQQAVIEIMEKMYLLQVHATERLAQWLCTRCGEVLTCDTPVLSDFFIKCVAVTYDRPAQFIRVINEVSRARKAATIRRFYDLLSKGGNGHQPLDALSHDAVKYIGTLLSWIHQSIAEEEDLLRCFFPRNTASNTAAKGGGSAKQGDAEAGGGDLSNAATTSTSTMMMEAIGIKDVLDQIFEPLCKHFRTRFDQITDRCVRTAGAAAAAAGLGDHQLHHLQQAGGGGGANNTNNALGSSSVMIVFFQLEGILGFYSETISHILSPSASLSATIEAAKLDTLRIFYNFMQVATSQMLTSVGGGGGASSSSHHPPSSQQPAQPTAGPAFLPADLAPTREVMNMMRLLKGMLDAMAEGLVPHSKREAEIAPVMGAIVDPLVNIAAVGSRLIAAAAASSQQSTTTTISTPPPQATASLTVEEASVLLPAAFSSSAAEEDALIARLVFSVNLLSRLHDLLQHYAFTKARSEKIAKDLATESALLTAASVRRALTRTGLFGRWELLAAQRRRGVGEDVSLSSAISPLTPEDIASIEAAAKQLYTYVYSVGALPTASLEKMQQLKLRDEILKQITASVCDSYEKLYNLAHFGALAPTAEQKLQHQQRAAANSADASSLPPPPSTAFYPSSGNNSMSFYDGALKAALCHSPAHMRVLLDVDTIAAAGGAGNGISSGR